MVDASYAMSMGWKLYRAHYRINILRFRFFLKHDRKLITKKVKGLFPGKTNLNQRLICIFGRVPELNGSDHLEQSKLILVRADEYLRKQFDILGSGPTILEPLDWHADFKSGKRWAPGKFYKDYKQIDLSDDSDVKVPRELSRGHHLLTLGQAYHLSGDEKYVIELIRQIDNWIDENPLMRSINWGCAMDVAIRAVNWLYALWLISSSPSLSNQFSRKIAVSLYEHGFFVYGNLEKSFVNSNNHYMSDLVGLIYLGEFFQSDKTGQKWHRYAKKEFFQQIRHQIMPSGVSYEMSVSYHRLMVELVFYTYLFLVRNDYYIPLDIKCRVRSMFDFVFVYTKPNGKVPIIGDQDDGRLLPFSQHDILDHRYLLKLAAEHYKDYSLIAGWCINSIERLYLLNNPLEGSGIIGQTIEPNTSSKFFSDAGFCVLNNDNTYVFITNSGAATYPEMQNKWGSHSHADMLSFELNFFTKDIVVDAGTGAYSSDPALRNRLRNSSMHNVLLVDGIEQQEYDDMDIFKTLRISRPLFMDYHERQNEVICHAAHDAYLRIDDPVHHERKFVLSKLSPSFSFIDTVTCRGVHSYRWLFHFDPKVIIELKEKGAILRTEGVVVQLNIDMPAAFMYQLEDVLISRKYGTTTPTKRLVINVTYGGDFAAIFAFTASSIYSSHP